MITVLIRYHGEYASRITGMQEELAVSEDTGIANVMKYLKEKYSIESTNYYIKRSKPLLGVWNGKGALSDGEVLEVFPISAGGLLSQMYSKGYISKF